MAFTLMERQVAGLSYCVNIEELRTFEKNAKLTLEREEKNPHDKNAVRLDLNGKKIGYVPRADALIIAALIDNGYFGMLHARVVDVVAKRGMCVFAITMDALTRESVT